MKHPSPNRARESPAKRLAEFGPRYVPIDGIRGLDPGGGLPVHPVGWICAHTPV